MGTHLSCVVLKDEEGVDEEDFSDDGDNERRAERLAGPGCDVAAAEGAQHGGGERAVHLWHR